MGSKLFRCQIGPLFLMNSNLQHAIIDIPFGDFSYLFGKNIEALPRSHLRRHLSARNLSNDGTRVELSDRLKESIMKENEERCRLNDEHVRRFSEIAALEEQGAVYVCGNNSRGQLGLGDLIERREFTVIPSTRGLFVENVITDNDISFAITRTNHVYSWGSRSLDSISRYFRLVDFLEDEDFTGIGMCANYAIGANFHGDVYCWGDCREQVDSEKFDMNLKPYLINKNTTSISTGRHHWCALDMDGSLYACGEVGLGPEWCISLTGSVIHDVSIPFLISTPERIRMVSCGPEHTICSSTCRIFAFGSNDGGRLGLGDNKQRKEICEIKSLNGVEILDISAGTWHSACIGLVPPLLDCGMVYTWGSGYSGQLGQGNTTISKTPAIVPYFLDGIIYARKVFCGQNHNAVIDNNFRLITWGGNQHNCLGRDIDEKDVEFTPNPGIVNGFGTIVNKIGRGFPKKVALGRSYTIVCTKPYEGSRDLMMNFGTEQDRQLQEEEKAHKKGRP